ncbi:MAG: LysM peptidoglycan-binding domain-containing protein [Phycisphaerales bacterium]|nr:LysM peptidoglycan-binding domain-containing protein [Phycisphaerales bacterium]
MSKEVKLGVALAGLVVVTLGLYVKYGGKSDPGQVQIQPSAQGKPDAKPGLRPSETGTPSPSSKGTKLVDRGSGANKPAAPESAPTSHGSPPAAKPADATTEKDAPSSTKEETLLAGKDDLDNQPADGPPGEAAPGGVPTLKDLRLASGEESGAGTAPSTTPPAGDPAAAPPAAATGDASKTDASGTNPGSSAQPGATGSPAAAMEYYQVQPGDTYARIARMYYGSERHAEFLRTSNADIFNGGPLRDGVRIRIPALPSPGAPALASALGNQPADGARPGESGKPGTAPPKPGAAGAKGASGKPAPKAAGAGTPAGGAGRTHLVRAGETFYTIAKRELGSAGRWKELLALNHDLVDGEPKNLRAGHVLKMPNS